MRTFSPLPPLVPSEIWLPVDARRRIECDSFHLCGQDATWRTQRDNLYACDYHRFLADVERVMAEMGVQSLGVAA